MSGTSRAVHWTSRPRNTPKKPPQNFFPVDIGLIPAPNHIPLNTHGTFVNINTGEKTRRVFRGLNTIGRQDFWKFIKSGNTNNSIRKFPNITRKRQWDFLVEPRYREPAAAAAPVPLRINHLPRAGGAGPAENENDLVLSNNNTPHPYSPISPLPNTDPQWGKITVLPWNESSNPLIRPKPGFEAIQFEKLPGWYYRQIQTRRRRAATRRGPRKATRKSRYSL